MAYKNYERYSDPTAGAAIASMRRDEVRAYKKRKQKEEYERFTDMLEQVHKLCKDNGFALENRIWLKDERTGKIWK